MKKVISLLMFCIVLILLSYFIFNAILHKNKEDDYDINNNNNTVVDDNINNNNQVEENNNDNEIIIDDSIDLNILDKTSYDWWITLNDINSQPRTDEKYYSFLEDSNGYFLGESETKTIYLTFDEGYENGYTPLILDTLKKHNLKSVFFITQGFLESSPELVKRMIDEGHIIGNHTCTHPDLTLVSFDKIKDEIENLDQMIFDEFGIRTLYFRPPMGKLSEYSLACINELGYKTIFWSYAYDDWDTSNIRGADYAFDKVISHAHNGAVYLLHAVSKDNAEALDQIIAWFIENGYELAQLDF